VVARLGEAFTDALTASVGEGVYAIDLEGRLTYMNPAAARILGWEPEELLGVEIHDLLHRYDAQGRIRPATECSLFAVVRTGVPITVDDDVFVHRDGHLVPIACSSSPIVTDGETIGAVVAFHDISEQKRTQARLVTEAQINETLLGIATALNDERDLTAVVQLVIDAGTTVTGAAYGAFFYNVVDDRGEPHMLYAVSGVDRSAFELLPLPRNTAVIGPTFAGADTVRFDDVTAAPEYGQSPPFGGVPEGHPPVRSYLAAPVVDQNGEVLGGLLLGHPDAGVFTALHERLVEAMAAHAASALRNARQLEQEQRISETLQRSMLPRTLPTPAGIDATARYLPAQDGAEVGGDWYDVVPLGGDRFALVMGDVAGHNVRAASVMAEVRNAVRAYAVEGHSPSGVIERANRFLCLLAPEELATCCYMELQLSEGTATIVLAGHPPPLISVGGESWFVEAETGMPLGVDHDARFGETTVRLPRDGMLALYTDGLVDQVHLPLAEGLERLRLAVAESSGDLETTADSILVETAGVRTHDDAALLLVALSGALPEDSADIGRWLPRDPGSAAAARRFVGDVLAGWDLGGEQVTIAQLLVSELVTNAVIHTAGPLEVRVHRQDDGIRVAVRDESGERPAAIASGTLDGTSGRGLVLVDKLSSCWGVDVAGMGKIVWFELVPA